MIPSHVFNFLEASKSQQLTPSKLQQIEDRSKQRKENLTQIRKRYYISFHFPYGVRSEDQKIAKKETPVKKELPKPQYSSSANKSSKSNSTSKEIPKASPVIVKKKIEEEKRVIRNSIFVDPKGGF
jgi:hypothetical protein